MHLCAGQVPVARITITPAKLKIPTVDAAKGGTVTVLCEPPVFGFRTLVSLVIYRVLAQSDPKSKPAEVAQAAIDIHNGQTILNDSSVAGTVSGGINEKRVQLIMDQVKCDDAGMFICEVSAFAPGSNAVLGGKVNSNLTVEGTYTGPGYII